jgi:outer membrane protein TolC
MKKIGYLLPVALFLWSATVHAATLSLRECLQRAASSNLSLKAAAFDEKIAEENVRTAASGFLPRVDFQGGYVLQLEPQAVKFAGNAMETQEPRFAFLNLSIYETLFDFGRTTARRDQASLLKEASRHGYSALEQDIFLQVVRAYFGIMEALRSLAAADDEVAQMVSHLGVAQNLHEQGVVTRNDLLQAEVRLAAARQKRFAVANAIDNGWLLLNFLTGQQPAARGELEEDVTVMTKTEAAAKHDLSGRGELVALRKSLAARELAIKESKSFYYPELFARLSLDYVQNDKVREQSIVAATVGLKVNLYDGDATTARLRQAVKTRSREEEKLRDLEARVALELETATNDLKVAAARIPLMESAIRQAEENLRINRDRYQEQVGTATEVLDAQTLLSQTRTDYYRALFDSQVAAARVRRSTGEL